MKLTLTQAAAETGKDRSTIFRAIKKGTISAEKQEIGGYLIDTSELYRVYSPKTKDEAQHCAITATQQSATDKLTESQQAQIDLMREQITDLKTDRDHWRRQATMLLTHQPETQKEPEQPTRSLLLEKLFGRKNI